MEIVFANKDVNKIVQRIVKEAKTGNIGVGKIFISSIENVIHNRLGITGRNGSLKKNQWFCHETTMAMLLPRTKELCLEEIKGFNPV